MKASEGGLGHETIMRLTWRQFQVYLDSFTWMLQEESDEGRTKNRRADMIAMRGEPRLIEWKKRLVEETYRKLDGIKPKS